MFPLRPVNPLASSAQMPAPERWVLADWLLFSARGAENLPWVGDNAGLILASL